MNDSVIRHYELRLKEGSAWPEGYPNGRENSQQLIELGIMKASERLARLAAGQVCAGSTT